MRQVPGEEPAIRNGDAWTPIYRVHSIGDLHRHFTELLREHIDKLANMTTTDWCTIPAELADWVAQIEEFDQRSTFFRYPGSGDELKSDFRQSSVAEIWSSLAPDGEPIKGFLEFDEEDRLVGAFCLDPSQLEPVMAALRKTSEALSRLHFALRSELGRGS